MCRDILLASLNVPGSWHDSCIARNAYGSLHDFTNPGFFLVADTAFPWGTTSIDGKIKVPVKSGQWLPSDADELTELLGFNCQLLSYRQTAEWGMHSLQGSFGWLDYHLMQMMPGHITVSLMCACICTNLGHDVLELIKLEMFINLSGKRQCQGTTIFWDGL
jgi:hypothetical protein